MFETFSTVQTETGCIDNDKLALADDAMLSKFEEELLKEIKLELFNKNKSFLINFEGGDGSGKETQTKYLEAKLNEFGFKAKRMDFPDYDDQSPEIAILKEVLSGKHGSISKLNPMFRASLYAADRCNHKARIEEALRENNVVILDRYNASNIYNADVSSDKFDDFVRVSEFIEFGIFDMPEPDTIVYLDSAIGFIEGILKERSKTGTVDEFEKRKDFQLVIKDRYKKYLEYTKQFENHNCSHVKCYDSNENQLSIKACNILVLYEFYITIVQTPDGEE